MAAIARLWRFSITESSGLFYRHERGIFRCRIPSSMQKTHSYVTLNTGKRKNKITSRRGLFVLGVAIGSYVGFQLYNHLKNGFFETRTLLAQNNVNLDKLLEIPKRVGSKSKQFNFVADVVETIAPAVVHIEGHGRGDGFLGCVVVPSGSGFLITEDGLVLTNAHVVKNMRNVKVTLADGSLLLGDIVSLDPASDLAAVQLRNPNKVSYLCSICK